MEIMSKSYAQIVKQIESLKQEAEKIRRSEVDGVIARSRASLARLPWCAATTSLPSSSPRWRAARRAANVMPQ
mgnify:CR=1 FL=1